MDWGVRPVLILHDRLASATGGTITAGEKEGRRRGMLSHDSTPGPCGPWAYIEHIWRRHKSDCLKFHVIPSALTSAAKTTSGGLREDFRRTSGSRVTLGDFGNLSTVHAKAMTVRAQTSQSDCNNRQFSESADHTHVFEAVRENWNATESTQTM